MKRRDIVLVLGLGLLFGSLHSAAAAAPQEPTTPPFSMRLLPGYQHRGGQGFDTTSGRIWKQNGLTIHYDIGRLASNQAQLRKEAGKYLWYKEQVFDGRLTQLVLTPERMLIVTFPETTANFVVTVPTEAELAEAILMVLTYSPAPVPAAPGSNRSEQ